MARKNIGSSTPRKRKTAVVPMESAAVQPANGQVAPEAGQNLPPTGVVAVHSDLNLDEEIRRRAYELYLERNGAAGDPNRDWFIAEREVRSRYAGAGHPSALAARQGQG